jgi:N-acetylmuramoyl-L-alanine amidase
LAKTKIFIDAGHGGKDSGAVGNGIMEKDIVLKIVKKMDALLKNYQDVEVMLSRSTDVFLSLDERTRKANNWNANVLISVHVNSAASSSAKGFESFRYIKTNDGTIAFQNVLHQEIMRKIGSGITDRGKKQENLHMLRDSKMKAVLTENLFISNSTDAAKLKSDSFLDQVAEGHVAGLEKFLGLKRIEKPPQQNDPSPSDPTTGKLFYVQVGAFEDKENADALAADLLREGFRSFVKFEDKLYKVQAGAFEDKENADALAKQLISEGFRAFVKYE